MKFIYGVETKDGIMAYTRGFNCITYKLCEDFEYIALMRDKQAYEDYVDTTTHTDLGIFWDYERAHEGYKKGCMDLAMKLSNPNTCVGKMWFVKNYPEDIIAKSGSEIIEYCLIESIKSDVQENKVVFIANTREIRIRRKNLSAGGLDYIQFAHNPYNIYIVNAIKDGKATEITSCIENKLQIKSVANENIQKFYEMFFRKF